MRKRNMQKIHAKNPENVQVSGQPVSNQSDRSSYEDRSHKNQFYETGLKKCLFLRTGLKNIIIKKKTILITHN